MRADFENKIYYQKQRHLAELTGIVYAFVEVDMTRKQYENYKARAQQALERQARERDDLFNEMQAALAAEKEKYVTNL